jgi:hypothetical protein
LGSSRIAESQKMRSANREQAKRRSRCKGDNTGAHYSKLKQHKEWQSRHEGINIAGKPLIEKQAGSGCSQQGHKISGELLIFQQQAK